MKQSFLDSLTGMELDDAIDKVECAGFMCWTSYTGLVIDRIYRINVVIVYHNENDIVQLAVAAIPEEVENV